MDASQVLYTGLSKPNIPISPGQTLQTILANIDSAISNSSVAPDFSLFNLHCLRPTYTITNTQQFAESITLVLCNLKTAYDAFVGGSYISDQSVLVTAINDLQDPALIYAPFGILNSDSIQQVWAKMFTGLSDMATKYDPSTANWDSLGVDTPPESIADAFDIFIETSIAMSTDISTKEDNIGIFNNTDCLDGGATDTPRATILALKEAVCNLPVFDSTAITFLCVSAATTLEGTLDNIIGKLSDVTTNYIANTGLGLVTVSNGNCAGYRVAIDDEWEGLYKVAVDSADVIAGTPDFLGDKIISSDASLDVAVVGDKLDITIANVAVDEKVKVNASDPSAGYLINKFATSGAPFGISLAINASGDNSKVYINPSIDGRLFIQNFMNMLTSDPELFSLFCAAINQCTASTCLAITTLTVTYTVGSFLIEWTPAGGSTVSQTVKYRQSGTSAWISSANVTAPNPQSITTDAASVDGVSANTVYEFQVDSICPDGINGSNIAESIEYDYANLNVQTDVNGHAISITMDPLSTVEIIEYRLKSGSTVKENKTATGKSPSVTFSTSGITSGTYHVEYRLGTTVNGVTLYSNDASQLSAWGDETGIIVA